MKAGGSFYCLVRDGTHHPIRSKKTKGRFKRPFGSIFLWGDVFFSGSRRSFARKNDACFVSCEELKLFRDSKVLTDEDTQGPGERNRWAMLAVMFY